MTAAAVRFPLTLHVEGEPALAEALAASINPQGYITWASAALLICRRETVALVRRSLFDNDVSLRLDSPLLRRSINIYWESHLEDHPYIRTSSLEGGWVHLLAVPRCSLVDHLRAFPCPRRIIMGRSRGELLRNAYRCLMALSPFPLHPSWEAPIMERFLQVADLPFPPLLLYPESSALHFALLDIDEAAKEVEQLWKTRALPIPDAI
jgi:hypothetical protein